MNAKQADAYVLRGTVKRDKGDEDGEMGDYNRAIEVDAKNSLAFFHRGALKGTQKRFRDAIADLDAAIKLNAKDPEAFLLRGHLHSAWADELSAADAKRQCVEAAVEDYTRSIDLSPTAPSFYFRSGEYEQLKRYDEALKDAEEAVRLDPKDASYLAQRGWMYRRTHHESLAQNDFRRALELDPGNKDYAEAARGEEKANSSQLTTGEKIAIGAGAAAGALWLLDKAISHDDHSSGSDVPSASGGTKVRCPKCNGSGRIVRRVLEWVPREYWGGPDPFPTDKVQEWRKHEEKCDRCDGKGWVDK